MTTGSRKNQIISSSPEIAMQRLTWLVFKQICSILLTEKKPVEVESSHLIYLSI
jgi:hypothetical protein